MALTLSPSSTPYLSCLKKFHVIKVLRKSPIVQATTSPAIRYGTIIHSILRDLYSPVHGNDTPHKSQLKLFMQTAFLEAAYENEQDMAHDWQRAEELLQHFLKADSQHRPYNVLAVEKFGTNSIHHKGHELYNVSARLDKIIVYNDSPTVCVAVDYKVRGKRTRMEVDQIFINLVVLKMLYPGYDSYILEIQHLSNNGIDRSIYRSAALKGVVHLVTKRVQRYLDADSYPPEPGECCLYCPLLKECQQNMPSASIEEIEF